MRTVFAAFVLSAVVIAAPSLAVAQPAAATRSIIHVPTIDAEGVTQVRTVCRTDPQTQRRVCVIDRSQPPTVCHWVRDQAGNIVRDCY